MSRTLVSFMTLLLLLRPAQTQEILVPAGGWLEGPFLSCAVREGVVLAGSGGRLSIYDLGDPANPRLEGSLPLPFAASHLDWLDDQLAVVTGPQGEFAVVDLQDATHPTLRGQLNLGAAALGLATGDQLAYVTVPAAQWRSDLRVIDLTDPDAPVLTGTQSIWEGSHLQAAQGRLWVSTGNGVKIFGLDNPPTPTLLGTVDGLVDGRRFVAVNGDTLYMQFMWESSDGVQAVNTADPAHPQTLGSLPDCYGGAILGCLGSWVYAQCGDESLSILDFSNPAAPIVWDTIPFPGAATNADQDGNLLVSINTGEVVVTSLATPEAPEELARIESGQATTGVASSGRFAWLAQRGQIVTLDVRDPLAVTQVGSYPTGEDWMSRIISMTLRGDTLLVSRWAGLLALRVDEEGLLHPLAELGAAWDAVLQDGLLAVAGMSEGLRLYDVSTWSAPELLATLPLGNARNVERLGDLAVVFTNQPSVLHVVDVRNPRAPQELSQVGYPDQIMSMTLADSVVYVGAGTWQAPTWRLDRIDVSRPEAPQSLGSLTLPFLPQTLQTGADYLYAGALAGGQLELFERTVDGGLTLLQELQILGADQGMACAGNLVYLPAGDRGLLILRNTRLGDPAFTPVLTAQVLPNLQLQLSWTRHAAAGVFRLEAAPDVAGPWEVLATTPDTDFVTSISGGRRCYRVTQVYR